MFGKSSGISFTQKTEGPYGKDLSEGRERTKDNGLRRKER